MMLVQLLAEGFERPISLFDEPPQGRLCYFPERLLRSPDTATRRS